MQSWVATLLLLTSISKMKQAECFRRIKPVDIRPILPLLDELPFFYANAGGTSPDKYECFVVLSGDFPQILHDMVSGLELGGRLGRSILRRLGPGVDIPPHTDTWMPDEEEDWKRFQIPLTSHPDIIMRWPDDNVSVHLEPGWLYEVRRDRTHEVNHNAGCQRIHLQIDQIGATV